MTQTSAQIYSRGYRRYDGKREGMVAAIWALATHTMRGVYGIGRPGRYKIAPILFGSFTYLRAIVIAGIAIILGAVVDLGDISYAETVNGNRSIAVLFAAVVAPGVLVTDRRNGLFDMYLTTPLNRVTYLIAKAIAITLSMMFITLGPGLVQLAGLTVSDAGPDGPVAWLTMLLRILVAGTVSAMLFGGLVMAVSAVADRAMTAGVAVAVVMLLPTIFVGLLVDGGYSASWTLISTINVSHSAVTAIFGETDGLSIPTYQRWLAVVAHLSVYGGIVAWRYSRRGSSR